MSDERGKAGAIALKQSATIKVKENKKKLTKALRYFRDLKIPLVKTELAKEYLLEEKVLLSPKGKQEIAYLLNENKNLKEELEIWKEKYKRIKKEIIYSKELFELSILLAF